MTRRSTLGRAKGGVPFLAGFGLTVLNHRNRPVNAGKRVLVYLDRYRRRHVKSREKRGEDLGTAR